jgi:hypothetical protein
MTEPAPVLLTPGVVIGVGSTPPLDPEKQPEGEWPSDVRRVPIPVFDTGVFIAELINEELLPKKLKNAPTADEKAAIQENPEVLLELARNDPNRADQLLEGTYRGTQLAITKIYDLIEKKYGNSV